MRTTLGKLRKLLEAKLGVAGAYPPGEAWGIKDDPEVEDSADLNYIATEMPPNFTPDPETVDADNRRVWADAKKDMDKPWLEPEPDPFPIPGPRR